MIFINSFKWQQTLWATQNSKTLYIVPIIQSTWNHLWHLLTLALPSVLSRCWLGSRKGIRPVKTERWGAGVLSVWSEVLTVQENTDKTNSIQIRKIQHSASKRGELILQRPRAHTRRTVWHHCTPKKSYPGILAYTYVAHRATLDVHSEFKTS